MIETPPRARASEPTSAASARPAIVPDGSIGTDESIDGPPLPPPPDLGERARRASRAAHLVFRLLNPRTTVPILRSGLGAWMGTPLGGWLLVVRVRGRRSGAPHDIPLSYLLDEGSVWVMAGFGPQTQWYRNILASGEVELVLPGRPPMRAMAVEVRNRAIRARVLPRLVRATGVPGYMAGADPFRAPAERILAATSWVPLIRIRPESGPLVPGPDDPGGHGWVWRQIVVASLTIWAARRLTAVLRVAGRAQPPATTRSV